MNPFSRLISIKSRLISNIQGFGFRVQGYGPQTCMVSMSAKTHDTMLLTAKDCIFRGLSSERVGCPRGRLVSKLPDGNAPRSGDDLQNLQFCAGSNAPVGSWSTLELDNVWL
jgi:hypothetical protein